MKDAKCVSWSVKSELFVVTHTFFSEAKITK